MSGWDRDHTYDDDSSTSWWSSMTGRTRRDSREGAAAGTGIFDWWRSENFQLLLVFVPFAIAAGARGWGFDVVFSLNAIAIAGLEVFTNSHLDRLCLSLAHRTASGLCSVAVPAIFPTTVSSSHWRLPLFFFFCVSRAHRFAGWAGICPRRRDWR